MSAAWFDRDPGALPELEATLRARFPTLHAFMENGKCRVRGTMALRTEEVEFDRYSLEILLPDEYSALPPRVWETAGRIPRHPDRHVFLDGALCLGTPLAMWIELAGDFRLERVLDISVRNFLIGNSLVEEGGLWPYGERSHGAMGMIEHLAELLGTARPAMVATFLHALAAGGVTKHSPCPCASGRKLLKCHHSGLKALRRIPPLVLHETASLILAEFDSYRLAA